MLTLIKWLAVQTLVWALAFAGGHYWLDEKPQRIVIGIDASFAMAKDWDKVRQIVAGYARKSRYSEFAVVTGKSRVHGWQQSPQIDTLVSFGPRRLERITDGGRYPEIEAADKRVLITNDANADAAGWDVVRP